MKSSPLADVKKRFNDKAGLVSAVQALATDELWLGKLNEDKGLDCVSNKKLLRLHEVLEGVKKDFGSRAKLVGKILELEGRTKDEGFKARLEKQSTPRLLDHARSAQKRA
jgi:hypothetical protein